MKGLILMDFYHAMRTLKYQIIFILIFIAVFSFTSEFSWFIIYACAVSAVLPQSLIALDERDKWCAYFQTLPVSKAAYVSEKYLLGIIINLSIMLICTITQLCAWALRGGFDADSLLFFLSESIGILFLIPSFMMPFIFRVGSEKGRIASIITVVTIIGIAAAIFPDGNSALPIILTFTPAGTFFTVTIFSFALYAASWALSIKFYEKRTS